MTEVVEGVMIKDEGKVMKAETGRAIVCGVVALLAASGINAVAAAERYPSRAVRAIVPFAPGGVTPEAFAEHIRREIVRWAEVVRISGYTPE